MDKARPVGRPGGRGVDAECPRDNLFRRLVTLCGLSAKEVEGFLELSASGVEQKMRGVRGIAVDEEMMLARLAERIRKGTVDDSDPPNAVRQARAFVEAAEIVAGRDE